MLQQFSGLAICTEEAKRKGNNFKTFRRLEMGWQVGSKKSNTNTNMYTI